MNTVFNMHPIYPDESLACYLLRLATAESVSGIAGLIGHLKFGTNNTALNRKPTAENGRITRRPHANRLREGLGHRRTPGHTAPPAGQ